MNVEDSSKIFAAKLAAAKSGDQESLGSLFESYRPFLTLMVELQLGKHLKRKLDAADVVQEIFLDAHRAISKFNGTSEPEFSQWLRAILTTRIASVLRHYLGTQQRDLRLEQQIQNDLDHSAMTLGKMVIDPNSSPSQHVAKHEQSQLAVDALMRLADDYRDVLIMRHMEGLKFPEIAIRMNRSVDSVEKLWLRGLTKLKSEFAQS